MTSYDVAVIGAGPGGYVAAIKLAQLGKKVVCIDNRDILGGTCLNVGCIPSKALLCSSHKYKETLHDLSTHGIDINNVSLSLEKMMGRKEKVVKDLGKGIASLFKKNKVSYIQGNASFIDSHTLEITDSLNQKTFITTDNIIIATGSESISLPGVTVSEKRIVSSTGALSLSNVPKKMLIVGAGVIGLEIGSIWSRLGSAVTIIEYSDRILSGVDDDISKEGQKILSQQGINFIFNAKVQRAEEGQDIVTLFYESDGKVNTLEADILLSAVGRKSYTKGLNLENVGVSLNKYGQIIVNANFKTDAAHIYAIGDVISGPMLAHKASEEGLAVAEIISTHITTINYQNIPSIIYTHPEIAIVGETENKLKEQGIDYIISKFPLMANSRSRANGETAGLVKMLVNKKTDEILGATIIAPNAGELIQSIVVAMEFKASSEDLARTSFGHPGVSEAIKEAALGAYEMPIHI